MSTEQWHDLPGFPGVSVALGSMDHPKFRAAVRRLHPDAPQMGPLLPVLAEVVLKDWKGIEDDKGRPLRFSRTLAIRLARDRSFERFFYAMLVVAVREKFQNPNAYPFWLAQPKWLVEKRLREARAVQSMLQISPRLVRRREPRVTGWARLTKDLGAEVASDSIRATLTKLSPRMADIIRIYYQLPRSPLGADEGGTLYDVAEFFRISPSRASQLKLKALDEIRRRLRLTPVIRSVPKSPRRAE